MKRYNRKITGRFTRNNGYEIEKRKHENNNNISESKTHTVPQGKNAHTLFPLV